MKTLWLAGVFFVILTGVWMGMRLERQQGAAPAGLDAALSISFQDSAFVLVTSDCRCCHGSAVTRHHLLAERKLHDCTYCHDLVFSEPTQKYEAVVVRDCLTAGCHTADATFISRHHVTAAIGQQECTNCHLLEFDDAAQTYFIDLWQPCDEAVQSTSVSHYSAHAVAPSDCESCHVRNLLEVHNQQCHLCHQSLRPVVRGAIVNQETRCTTCHTESPHSLKCQICHGSDRTYLPDEKPQIHMMHMDKISCGVCHEIPESINLEPTGQYCSLCHVVPRSYTRSQLPEIHRLHTWKTGYFPYACYMCHGQSVPRRQVKHCFPCHDDRVYQANTLKQVHYEHNRRFDCSNCHYNPRLFDLSPVTPCFRCHEPRAYASVFDLHFKHQTRQCWSCHASKDVSARAGFTCESCHGAPKAFTSSAQVHLIHDSKGFQCWACHTQVISMYAAHGQEFDSAYAVAIEGVVTDGLDNKPLAGATLLANPGGALAVTAEDGTYILLVAPDRVYSVTASMMGYESARTEVQVSGKQTVFAFFTLISGWPGVDTDGDGLTDDFESRIGTDPLLQDTDGDGMTDYHEVAYDGDPTTYAYGPLYGPDLNPLYIDSDGDGLVDGFDGNVLMLDYPIGIDFDGDGYVDGEMDYGTDPLDPASSPGDGDMNRDGKLDVGDVLIAQRIASGLITPTFSDYVHGNVAPVGRPDGALNIADVLMIQRRALP